MARVTLVEQIYSVELRPNIFQVVVSLTGPIYGGGGASGGSSSWNDITGKPSAFPPAAHTHALSDVTGLIAALDAKQDAIGFTPENAAQKGVPGGYAGLDGTGKVPAAQLPDLAAVAFSGSASDLATGTLPAARLPAFGSGDVSFAAGGGAGMIAAGAVTLSKMASLATSTILGRATAGNGDPEALTPAQVRTILNVADGATANASDAALRDRATHTGTQPAATITGLAAVATSGSASDLTTGTLPAAAFDDAAHGARAGGALHAAATASVAGFMSAADKTKLDGVAAGANNYVHPDHTGDVTSTGDGTTSLDKTAITGKATVTPDGADYVLISDTSDGGNLKKALVSGLGGGGGGSPGGASGEVQFNNAGSFGGAADVQIEGGQLRLPAIATPAAPAADGLKLFCRKVAGRVMPAFMGPSGLDSSLQPSFARNKMGLFLPAGNGGADAQVGIAVSATGTATTESVATTNLHNYMRRRSWRVTTASTTAVAGLRGGALQWTLGGPSAGLGGFHLVWRWGPATGVATATHRAFVGMRNTTAAPTDVNPSTLTNMFGMGYDSADTNIQFMHNDGAGTATKIDLGSGFPKPGTDLTAVYEIALFAPPGTTQTLGYEVTNLVTGAVATGIVTTDIPATTTLLTPYGYMSVGGTSSVIGFATMGLYIESDY